MKSLLTIIVYSSESPLHYDSRKTVHKQFIMAGTLRLMMGRSQSSPLLSPHFAAVLIARFLALILFSSFCFAYSRSLARRRRSFMILRFSSDR